MLFLSISGGAFLNFSTKNSVEQTFSVNVRRVLSSTSKQLNLKYYHFEFINIPKIVYQ